MDRRKKQIQLKLLHYRVHTDEVKAYLIPPELTPAQVSFAYASEADLLNTVLFDKTAREWREENPKGNIRDNATIYQLLVLSNTESYNAVLINENFRIFGTNYP